MEQTELPIGLIPTGPVPTTFLPEIRGQVTETFTPSYYDILGISKEADTDDVRRAYRRRVQDVHPDTGGGSTDGFLELSEAYQTLIDQDRRRVYDMYLNGVAMSRRRTDPRIWATPVDQIDSDHAMLFDAPGIEDHRGDGGPSRGGRRGGWRRRIADTKGRVR